MNRVFATLSFCAICLFTSVPAKAEPLKLYGTLLNGTAGGISSYTFAEISTVDGHVTALFDFSLPFGIGAMAFDPESCKFVATGSLSVDSKVVVIDPTTQTVTFQLITGLPVGETYVQAIEYNPNEPLGQRMLISFGPSGTNGDDRLAAIDPATGVAIAGHITGHLPYDLDGLAYSSNTSEFVIADTNNVPFRSISNIFTSPTYSTWANAPNNAEYWEPACDDTGRMYFSKRNTRDLWYIERGSSSYVLVGPHMAPTPSAWAVGLAFGTITGHCCPRPTIEICYDGGRDEACAMTAPNDPASRSSCLNVAYPGASWKDFDDQTVNRYFGHTFANLPNNIVGAQLQICMKPLNDPLVSNDAIYLGLKTCTPPSWAWGRTIRDLPGNGGTWNFGEACQCFTLDLTALPNANGTFTDIISNINAKCALDVLIQDDTAIESMKLTVTVCPCANPFVITRVGGLVDNFAALPADPACFRSPELNAVRPDWVCFDTSPNNDGVGYTFTNLPRGIVSATLDTRMRVDSVAGNDSINFDTPQNVWGSFIANLPESGGTWDNPGQTATFNLNLGNLVPNNASCSNILGTLGDRKLNVYVQDDTKVDYFRLRMATCPCMVRLTHFGLEHGPIGAATLATGSGNSLVVSNIGSSGQDGVAIALGDASAWHAQWEDVNGGGPVSIGQSIAAVVHGEVNNLENQTIASTTWTQTEQGPALLADFSGIGATTYTIRTYSNGVLQQTMANLPTSVTFHFDIGPFLPVDLHSELNPTGEFWITEWTYGELSLSIDRIVIVPDDPKANVGSADNVEIRLANAPSMILTSEALELSGLHVHTIGGALFGSARDALTISNIGSSGQDGCVFDLERNESFKLALAPVDPEGTVPNGAFVEFGSTGSLGGVPDRAFGTCRVTDVGSEYEITADYSPAGSTTHRLEVYNQGALVTTITGHTGPVARVPQWMGGCGKSTIILDGDRTMCYFPTWDFPLAISIIGGPTVIGDELRIRAENPSAPFDYLQTFSVAASGIPEMTFVSAQASFPADMNCDGKRNGLDVSAFTLAVMDSVNYGITYVTCSINNGDFNGDSAINVADTPGFVASLLAP